MRRICWLLLLMPLAAHATDELGRLFYSPAERRMIDMRQAPHGKNTEGAAIASEGVKLRGVVRARNGNTTVWLNDSVSTRRIPMPSAADAAPVILPDGRSVRLRVGEEWQDGAIKPPVVKIQPAKR